jgi:hypothetical protein
MRIYNFNSLAMRLASIINVWADCRCLLPYCIKNHLQFCDGVIVVWSLRSNHGNKNDAVLEYILANGHDSRVMFEQLEPISGAQPLINETRKRNHGISMARKKGFTHFLISDADEMYHPADIERDKLRFDNPKLNGLVSELVVYVTPTLWTDDHTLVPTIHKLTYEVYVGNFREYPFAYTGTTARIDPSRRPSFYSGIETSDTKCHHYSYVRKDMELKINNSSANLRKSRSLIYQEMSTAKAGEMSLLYQRVLKESPNFFDICI